MTSVRNVIRAHGIAVFRVGNRVAAYRSDLIGHSGRKCGYPGCDAPAGFASKAGLCMAHGRQGYAVSLTAQQMSDIKVLMKKDVPLPDALVSIGRPDLSLDVQQRNLNVRRNAERRKAAAERHVASLDQARRVTLARGIAQDRRI